MLAPIPARLRLSPGVVWLASGCSTHKSSSDYAAFGPSEHQLARWGSMHNITEEATASRPPVHSRAFAALAEHHQRNLRGIDRGP